MVDVTRGDQFPPKVLYLPRHTDLNELVVLAAHYGYGSFEVEKIYFAYPEVGCYYW